AMPSIFSGLKVSVTLAVVGAVVGEFVGSNSGIGYLLQIANGNFDLPLMFAALTVLSGIGVLLFVAVDLVERMLIPWHASQRGYFDQEGIDLDIQEGRGSGVTVQAVAAGTATFGYADIPTMMKAASKGAPVTAVGVALQTSPMSVMAFADKNIRKPEDLKGKTVAVTPGDSMSQIWPLFLKKTGLKEGDFKQVAGDAQTKLN